MRRSALKSCYKRSRILENRSMKRLLFILVTLASLGLFAQVAYASAFCDGYQAGFKAGACYQQFGCIPPIPPICPIPAIGESTYQDGYNRGFLEGTGRR